MEQELKEAPRKVALFSGHMIDQPGRKTPRFPPDKEPIASHAIAQALDAVGVGSKDLCICGGACGGDLLFAEGALARGARLELFLPLEEPEFLEQSVTFAGGDWRERFMVAKAHAVLHVLPLERRLPAGADPYEENNLWMLEAAERFGADKLDFICLWNGEAGAGPGGTKHLMEEVRSKGGRTHWLNTKTLWD